MRLWVLLQRLFFGCSVFSLSPLSPHSSPRFPACAGIPGHHPLRTSHRCKSRCPRVLGSSGYAAGALRIARLDERSRACGFLRVCCDTTDIHNILHRDIPIPPVPPRRAAYRVPPLRTRRGQPVRLSPVHVSALLFFLQLLMLQLRWHTRHFLRFMPAGICVFSSLNGCPYLQCVCCKYLWQV